MAAEMTTRAEQASLIANFVIGLCSTGLRPDGIGKAAVLEESTKRIATALADVARQQREQDAKIAETGSMSCATQGIVVTYRDLQHALARQIRETPLVTDAEPGRGT